MVSGDKLIRVNRGVGGSWAQRGRGAGSDGFGTVRFEGIETTKLLVYYREGLKALCCPDLFVKPGFYFVLFEFGQFLVRIIEVSIS